MPVRKATARELAGGRFAVMCASSLPPKWIEHMKNQAAERRSKDAASALDADVRDAHDTETG